MLSVRNNISKGRYKLTAKALKTHYLKRPRFYLTILSIGILLLLGSGAYYVNQTSHVADVSSDVISQNDALKNEVNRVVNTSVDSRSNDPDASSSNDPTMKTNTRPKSTATPNTSSPTNDTTCTHSTCQKSASFSITTIKSVIVVAGSTTGPFTASTIGGTNASWTTPSVNIALSPYGYTNANNLRDTSSYIYYIRADDNAKPGTYTLYLSAIDKSSRAQATASITVTVTPRPYFTVASSNDTYDINEHQRVVEIPYTITQHNGHVIAIDVIATIEIAPGQHYLANFPVVRFSNTSGKVIFDTLRGGAPEGVYTVKIIAIDANHVTAIDTIQVVVVWLYS